MVSKESWSLRIIDYQAIVQLFIACVLAVVMVGAAELDQTIHEQRDSLLQNAEDMVAHGGMGDAKAIIHHCEMAVRHAESLIKLVSGSHPDREATMVPLNEVIRQCKRVMEIGEQADPGVLLNPAIKARAAARSAIRSLKGTE
ncbi:MAG: hypothetical protein CV090_08415 [Nitrospira sp. WS238]|nr:hypothetical protein [Nitrospira sp. WS238]